MWNQLLDLNLVFHWIRFQRWSERFTYSQIPKPDFQKIWGTILFMQSENMLKEVKGHLH